MKLQEQIEQLDAIRRLRANPDYRNLVQAMLDEQVSTAHRDLLNPEIHGDRLAFARARYVAARANARWLDDKAAALEAAITTKQAELPK